MGLGHPIYRPCSAPRERIETGVSSVNEDEGSRLPSRETVRNALDEALVLQQGVIERHVHRIRHAHPEATPADVIERLEKEYLAAVTTMGAAVGAAAAAPGVGTGFALVASAGEVATYLEASALFVLSVAYVHGMEVHEVERRRTLLMAILLGDGGSSIIRRASERTGKHWARALIDGIPTASLKRVNDVLGRNFVTKWGTREGIIVLGRVIPFGIGAAIGGGANALMGQGTVKATQRAFGPYLAPMEGETPTGNDSQSYDVRDSGASHGDIDEST